MNNAFLLESGWQTFMNIIFWSATCMLLSDYIDFSGLTSVTRSKSDAWTSLGSKLGFFHLMYTWLNVELGMVSQV